MGPKYQQDGTWLYTPIGAALAVVGLEEIGVYIALFKNTVAHYIVNRPIMDLCLAAKWKLRMRLSRRWWEQSDLDVLWIRVDHAAE